jgi:XTP/dITP diphosphohydrolase
VILVMATLNAHKLREVREIVRGAVSPVGGLEIVGLEAWPHLDPPETGDTFVDNALEKARFVFEQTGHPTVADDSGLEVDALGGAPGVRSKRWTPEATDAANNARLLRELEGKSDRRARYRCALALVTAAGERSALGSCEGSIGFEERGSGGFGYDPYFLPEAYPGRTMAEISAEEKHAVSHRGQAFRELPRLLAELGLA